MTRKNPPSFEGPGNTSHGFIPNSQQFDKLLSAGAGGPPEPPDDGPEENAEAGLHEIRATYFCQVEFRTPAKGQSDEERRSRHAQVLESFGLYLNEIGAYKLLSAERELLLARSTVRGDRDSREKMILSNLRLVVAVAKRYQNRGLSLNDLVSEGNLGLIKAVEKFDPERGCRFSTYATWWIKQNIDRAVMNHARSVRLPVHILKELQQYQRAMEELRDESGHAPGIAQVARHMDKSVKSLRKLQLADTRACSVDAPLQEHAETTLLDSLPAEEGANPELIVANEDLKMKIARWLQHLNKRERAVLALRFGLLGNDSHTLEDVGAGVNLTRERVRQIQLDALARLRRIMLREGFSPDCLLD